MNYIGTHVDFSDITLNISGKMVYIIYYIEHINKSREMIFSMIIIIGTYLPSSYGLQFCCWYH